MSVLSLQTVSLEYPGTARKAELPHPQILDGITLHINSDEFVVVIGRSGSGKTSLLNLSAGFLAPTSGRISVDGHDITGPGADRAVVFQDDALYPWLNTRDNIAFPLRLRRIGKAERYRRAEDLLGLVGLAGAGDRRIWELSGGMRQRVGIARALASDPQFLLMDEPLGALDALTRTRMQAFLLKIWAESGAGVLLITHSIDEALLLATRIIVLAPHPGRIAADIPASFGRQVLAGTPVKQVKASEDFKRLHDRLTGLIHDEEEEDVAA